MLENLLESAKTLGTRDLFQRHVGSASEGPDTDRYMPNLGMEWRPEKENGSLTVF